MNVTPRDMGQAAEASSGGGTKGMLAEFGWLLLLSALVIALISLLFFFAAEVAVRWVSPKTEQAWMAELSRKLVTIEPQEEPLRGKWAKAQDLLARLAAQAGAPELEFRLLLLEEKKPNAFALPGGGIGLTRGLLEAIDDEVGLAFVIAHELGHFKHRDHLRSFIRDGGRVVALTLLFGQGVGIASEANRWMALDYSRDQERAADRYGLELVHRAFGHVRGAEKLFQKLQASESLPAWAYMFATHPDTQERLQNLRVMAAEWDLKD